MDGKPIESDVAAEKAETVSSVAPETAATPAPAVVDDDELLDAYEPLRNDIIAALKTVYDPEIPSDIYELGLIYSIDIDAERNVAIAMTLTAPGCPVAGEMPKWVENAVNAVPGVGNTSVVMTFDPPWDQSRMSDEARLALNMF
jgi:FeS assembly SUF system protein